MNKKLLRIFRIQFGFQFLFLFSFCFYRMQSDQSKKLLVPKLHQIAEERYDHTDERTIETRDGSQNEIANCALKKDQECAQMSKEKVFSRHELKKERKSERPTERIRQKGTQWRQSTRKERGERG